MRISIIGSGWLGCHVAYKMFNDHDVSIFDQYEIFGGSSFRNQNRLHLGYHYARNKLTRQLCRNTFKRFEDDYSEILCDVGKNVYTIPMDESLLDYGTYIGIFEHEGYKYEPCVVPEIVRSEGSIMVGEKYINPWKAKCFFENHLSSCFTPCKVDDVLFEKLRSESDLVVNCTNNFFNPIIQNSFYELCLMLKYERLRQTSFDALTLVDGKLFSIYPYRNNVFTLSCVEHTPIASFDDAADIMQMQSDMSVQNMDSAKLKFENTVLSLYPGFLSDFKYVGHIVSVKAKMKSESSNRHPIIAMDGNVLSCFSGKIQGIYCVEDFIRRIS